MEPKEALRSRMSILTAQVAALGELDDTILSLRMQIQERDKQVENLSKSKDEELNQLRHSFEAQLADFLSKYRKLESILQVALAERDLARRRQDLCDVSTQTAPIKRPLTTDVGCQIHEEEAVHRSESRDIMERFSAELQPHDIELFHNMSMAKETHTLGQYHHVANIHFNMKNFALSPPYSLEVVGKHELGGKIFVRNLFRVIDCAAFVKIDDSRSRMLLPVAVEDLELYLYPSCCCVVKLVHEKSKQIVQSVDFRHMSCLVDRLEVGVQADTISDAVRGEVIEVLRNCDTQVTEALTQATRLESTVRMLEQRSRIERDVVFSLSNTTREWVASAMPLLHDRIANASDLAIRSLAGGWAAEVTWVHSAFDLFAVWSLRKNEVYSESILWHVDSERRSSVFTFDAVLSHAKFAATLTQHWFARCLCEVQDLYDKLRGSSLRTSMSLTQSGSRWNMDSTGNEVVAQQLDVAWVDSRLAFVFSHFEVVGTHIEQSFMAACEGIASSNPKPLLIEVETTGDSWEADIVTPAMNHLSEYCQVWATFTAAAFENKVLLYSNAITRAQRALVARHGVERIWRSIWTGDQVLALDIARRRCEVAVAEATMTERQRERERSDLQALTHHSQQQQIAHLRLYENEVALIRDHQKVLQDKYEGRCREAAAEIQRLRQDVSLLQETLERERCVTAHQRRTQRNGLSECIALTEKRELASIPAVPKRKL